MSRSYSLSFLTVQEASPVEAVEIAAACGQLAADEREGMSA